MSRMQALSRALLVTCTLAAWPQAAMAFCRLTTVDPPAGQLCSNAGKPLAWFEPTSTVALFPRRKRDIGDRQIRDIIQRSFDTWSDAACTGARTGLVTDLRDEPATENEPLHREVGGNQNAIMFVDTRAVWESRMNVPNAIGLTSVFHSKQTGRIVGADMEINDWRGTLGICGQDCPLGITDLENVFTHEAGHYYGLGHVSDVEATMFSQAPAGDVAKRDLADDDIAGICTVYPASFRTDEGCGCAVIGAARPTRPHVLWLLPLIGLCAMRWRRREKSATEKRACRV